MAGNSGVRVIRYSYRFGSVSFTEYLHPGKTTTSPHLKGEVPLAKGVGDLRAAYDVDPFSRTNPA